MGHRGARTNKIAGGIAYGLLITLILVLVCMIGEGFVDSRVILPRPPHDHEPAYISALNSGVISYSDKLEKLLKTKGVNQMGLCAALSEIGVAEEYKNNLWIGTDDYLRETSLSEILTDPLGFPYDLIYDKSDDPLGLSVVKSSARRKEESNRLIKAEQNVAEQPSTVPQSKSK